MKQKKNVKEKDNTLTSTGKMKKIFDDLEYAVFGVFEPKPESEKLDIVMGEKSESEDEHQNK